jgi:hypothetical protein
VVVVGDEEKERKGEERDKNEITKLAPLARDS